MDPFDNGYGPGKPKGCIPDPFDDSRSRFGAPNRRGSGILFPDGSEGFIFGPQRGTQRYREYVPGQKTVVGDFFQPEGAMQIAGQGESGQLVPALSTTEPSGSSMVAMTNMNMEPKTTNVNAMAEEAKGSPVASKLDSSMWKEARRAVKK